MATTLRKPEDVDLSTSRRALVLVWQNPATRLFSKVGQIDSLPGGKFAFHYLPSAGDDPQFRPLEEFPEFGAVYVSDDVPAFFANRILTSERRGFATYLEWLGIDGLPADEVPFEVLARTGGGRATDTFHVVDVPLDAPHGFSSRFFVSGIRYSAASEGVVRALRNGSELRLLLDESNPVNTKAVLVNTADGERVGYVPDWLCGDVYARIKEGWSITALAEKVNPEAPPHVRVLCQITASPGRGSAGADVHRVAGTSGKAAS